MKPTEKEKAKYLSKITEWNNLGFDVTGLAELLETDFEMFKKRRLEILRGQISETPEKKIPAQPKEGPSEPAETTELEAEDEGEAEPVTIEVAPSDTAEEMVPEEEQVVRVSKKEEEERLMLIGKPLPVEPPPPDEEDTILITDTREERVEEESRDKKEEKKVSKAAMAAGVREIAAVEEAKEERREAKVDEEEEVPSGIVGMEAPPERKVEEREERQRPKRRKTAGKEPAGRAQMIRVFAVIVVGILIMVTLWYMMYTQEPTDGNGNGNGEILPITAVITVDKSSGISGETFNFNAQDSDGEISAYKWVFDADFRILSGSESSIFVTGYFAPTQAAQEDYTVTLTVEDANGQVDTETITITINTIEVSVSEEKLDDSAKYRVNGNITVTNSKGEIASFSQDTGIEALGDVDISIDKIVMNFENESNDPMTTQISESAQAEDGYMAFHDVYSRQIHQNLDVKGYMHAVIKSTISEYEDDLQIDGSIQSDEESFTDYTTGLAIKMETTNDLSLTSTIQDPRTISLPIQSNDVLTSYPDLRQTPTRLRLNDLSDEPIKLGDRDTVVYGTIAYSWYAASADQVLGNPALKLEFHLDSGTLKDNNIDEFYLNLWLGNNKPVALKSEMHVKFKMDDNDITLNYANRLIEYLEGTKSISSNVCNEAVSGSYHYYPKYSDLDSKLDSEFTSNWNFLPNLTTTNLDHSFGDYPPDKAINDVLPLFGVNSYLTNHPDAYVTSGYLNRTEGQLIWNLTFGTKGSSEGYNVRIGESGVIEESSIEISEPLNSTDEFWPLLTFAGSEYIFKAIDDDDINSNIFSADKINFDEVSYGVNTGLSYPTVDFTSVSNLQTQKLSYFALREKVDGWFSTAVDGETGQLLFKWDHSYAGIEIPF
jgi:hypothetical protein